MPSITLVPTGPPQDVVITLVTSTSISLSWNPPLFKDQNGFIREYYIAVCIVQSEPCYGVTSNDTSFTLVDLHPYYSYNLSIAAVTVGIGPLSESQHVTCLEEGKWLLTIDTNINMYNTHIACENFLQWYWERKILIPSYFSTKWFTSTCISYGSELHQP